MRIAVLGGGSWGSAFAALLAEESHDVSLVCRDPDQARAIAETGRNPRYVRDLDLSGVRAATFDDPALADAELFAVAVPSRAFREVVEALPPNEAPVLSLVKGLDPESGGRLSRVVRGRPAAVLSGPNHAEE